MVHVSMQSAHASKNQNADFIRVLMPLIILVILLLVGKKILTSITGIFTNPLEGAAEGLGMKDTEQESKDKQKAETNIKKMENSASNPFDVNYYTVKVGSKIKTLAATKDLAAKIYDSVGILFDEPDAMLAAFKNLQYKTQVSFLAKVFSDTYEKDLLEWLQIKMDTTPQKIALGKVINYVNSLKTGRP